MCTVVVTSQTNKAIGSVCEKLKEVNVPLQGPSMGYARPSWVSLLVMGNVDSLEVESKPYHIDAVVKNMIEAEPRYKTLKEGEDAIYQWFRAPTEDNVRICNYTDADCADLGDAWRRDPVAKLPATQAAICAFVKGKAGGYDDISKKNKKRLDKFKGKAKKVVKRLWGVIASWYKLKRSRYESDCRIRYRKHVLENSTVVLSTVSSLARKEFGDHVNAQVVIMDEAATVTEESMPLVLSVKPRYLIMVGDHKQLRPYTDVEDGLRREGIMRSFFERCVDVGHDMRMLATQYRMPRQLGEVVSKLFYDGDLISPANEQAGCVRWVDHNHHEARTHGKSVRNTGEAKIVVKVVNKLRAEFKKASIKIITFYSGQKEELEKLFKRLPDPNRHIVTVDSAQGSEADIVVLSCVRSRGIGFTKDPNRLNVALSRAKQKLVIVGSRQAFDNETNGQWPRLIELLPDDSVVPAGGGEEPSSVDGDTRIEEEQATSPLDCTPHEAGLEYYCNRGDIAADNMAAHCP